MNGSVLGATNVVKMNTVDVQTFQAPNAGALGYVLNGKVTYNMSSVKKHTTQSVFDVTNLNSLPKVGIVYSLSLIHIFGGMDKMVPRGSADFSTGPIGGIAANWQFAPSHTVRASLLAGNLARKIDNETLRRFGLQLDYLLNVTTYTSGYNPGRLFEFLTVAGIGYQYSSLAGNAEHVAELHLGIQLKLHPTAQVDFFIERCV